MAEVLVCSAAEADFAESLKWYADRSIAAANEFDAEVDRAVSEIAADPERFPLCDSRHRYFLLRRFPFRIIYRISRATVVVIAVAHGSRAPDFWANR